MSLETDYYWYNLEIRNREDLKKYCRYCGDFIGSEGYDKNNGMCLDCKERVKNV